jgi:hypothetical protein
VSRHTITPHGKARSRNTFHHTHAGNLGCVVKLQDTEAMCLSWVLACVLGSCDACLLGSCGAGASQPIGRHCAQAIGRHCAQA